MSRHPIAAAIAALLLLPAGRAAAAQAQPGAGPAAVPPAVAPAASPAAKERFTYDLRLATWGGGFDGLGVRRQSGGLAVVEASGRPQIKGEGWYLDVPVKIAHRQTFGTDLSETKGSLDLEAWYVASKRLRLGLDAGLSGASRKDWPDLYQPTNGLGGALLSTDRYSYLAWRVGPRLYARPAPHQHLRASYRFVSYDYGTDPAFDPDPITGDAMHLTPRDRTEHRVDLSWRYHQDSWRIGATLDYTRREFKTLLARNRRTGATPNNGPGGTESNPKQELTIWQPAAEVTLMRMGGKLEVSLGYGLDVWNDPYQGYYSLTAHVPKAQVQLELGEKLGVKAGLSGWYATYTADGSSRVEVPGARRKSSRTTLEGEGEYKLTGALSLRAQVEWTTRSTNYRDFVPPPNGTSSYDIDWDYTNLWVLAGIQYRL